LDNKGHLASKTQIVDGSQVMVQYLPKTVAFVSSKYRPKRTIKFSLLIDSQGIPLSTILGKANEHDSNLLEGTLTNSVINGLKWQENCLLGDKGYVGARQEMTALLSGFSSVFPPKKNQVKRLTKRKMDKLKNNRWKVERSISWIKNFRRLKICYEKSLESYQAYLDLACLSISFKKAFL
jgi:hypothetical protein